MFIQHYYIKRHEYDELYNILVISYLHFFEDYQTCVKKAFEYLELYQTTLPKNENYRLVYPIDNYDKGFCFYVNPINRKILNEGILSLSILYKMKYDDIYFSPEEIDNICKRYFLERKSERRIKIEKLLNG